MDKSALGHDMIPPEQIFFNKGIVSPIIKNKDACVVRENEFPKLLQINLDASVMSVGQKGFS